MSEATKHDVLAAADAFLAKMDLIEQLDEVLPVAESGDPDAMIAAAGIYATTGQPDFANKWIVKAVKFGASDTEDHVIKLIQDAGTWKIKTGKDVPIPAPKGLKILFREAVDSPNVLLSAMEYLEGEEGKAAGDSGDVIHLHYKGSASGSETLKSSLDKKFAAGRVRGNRLVGGQGKQHRKVNPKGSDLQG